MEVNVAELTEQIKEDFFALIGETKDKLTKEDLKLLQEAAEDGADLAVRKLAGAEDLEQEVFVVNATIANLSIANYLPVKNVFWNSVQRAATVVLSTLVKAAVTAAVAAV